ncbi:MAG: NAD(P)-dependent oxidoreductase, partial [Acidimicrobiales bacterium]
MSERILVTGGSGFIGTNLVQHLVDRDVGAVRNLDRAPPRNAEHRKWWKAADLRDGTAVLDAVREFAPTQIVHLGARTDLGGTTAADYAVNTAQELV